MTVSRLIAVALMLIAASPLSCSSDSEPVCEGVQYGSKCEKLCVESECAIAGSVCHDNACAQPCPGGNTKTECPVGTFCGLLDLNGDGDGNDPEDGLYCAIYPFAHEGSTGQSEACASHEDCDVHRGYRCDPATLTCADKSYAACTTTDACNTTAGFACVDGECRQTGCTEHADCALVGECVPGKTDTGESVLACKKTTAYPEGQFGTLCPGGADAGECDTENGFVCLGTVGQIDAYCTKTGCQADTDCATGYSCSTVRTSRRPCEAACGLTAAPSEPNCVPAADIGAGKEFSCGPVGLLRNMCLKREFCSECQTDADCLALPNQVCAKDQGGRKICTQLCDENTNSCPWGNAAICGVFDQELGKATCSHRFPNGCTGTGKSCEPCVDDLDCPNGLCLTSSFTHERFCLDLGPTCSCAGLPTEQNAYCQGGGCPQTPGGLTMHCYGGPDISSTSVIFNKCYGANVNLNPLSSPQTGCWPKL